MAALPYHPGKQQFASNLIIGLGKILLRFMFKIKLEGRGNIPETGPLLVLAKHQRIEDIPLGLSALVTLGKRRDQYCIMKNSLADPKYRGYFLKCGGIPVDRKDPAKSKGYLLYARHKLHEGNTMVIFPEQTFFPDKMGKGKVPGFRFVAGRPEHPIQVICVGFTYKKRRFRRTEVLVNVGKAVMYGAHDDPDHFLHERMHYIAELSGLHYPHPKSEAGKKSADEEFD